MEKAILALRMKRQHFLPPVRELEEYRALFRRMSPVAPVYWSCPGSPPSLPFHAVFDDAALCFHLRRERVILKGRFQGGNVGYIFADELPVFVSVYGIAQDSLSEEEQLILKLLAREGPMSIGLMKELTGLLAKQITPALHILQRKFLVFEDQADSEWDRAWYLFEDAFPESTVLMPRAEAVQDLLLRSIFLHVFATPSMLHAFYQLPVKEIHTALLALERDKRIHPVECFQQKGYVLMEDMEALNMGRHDTCGKQVVALHRNDFLVKSLEPELGQWQQCAAASAERGCKVLQYLLVDGEIHGAVLGFFKNGPFLVDDIVLDLPDELAERRRGEILQAVVAANPSPVSAPKRFMNRPV